MVAIRWGILGAGLISGDFVACLLNLPRNEHQVVAVAARNVQKAKEFADKYGIPTAYGSYDEISKDPNVDIAYVGIINSGHLDAVKSLLNNGKHVICEKPLGMNQKQVKEMVSLARAKKLFFMEAIWSRCNPIYQRIREEIRSKALLGDVIQVNGTFGVKIDSVERVTQKELGGGACMDIGIYLLQITNLAFGGKKPVKISANGHLNSSGVDECGSVTFLYEDGGMACLNYTTKQFLNNEVYIIGTKGYIKIESPFWAPTTLVLPDKQTYTLQMPKLTLPVHYGNSEALTYEAQEVHRCLKAGLLESPLIPLDESIALVGYLDEIRRQLGVKYDCD